MLGRWQQSRYWRWIGYSLFTVIILFALLLTTLRIATPYIASYKPEMTRYLSQRLGYPVRIKDVIASWHINEPVLVLKQVSVYHRGSKSPPIAQLQQLRIGIAPLTSLWHRDIEVDSIALSGLNLTLRTIPSGQLQLNGHHTNK